jgi:Ran GTPase-activating protein (RanGAP) involved in mRNA processing and transport
VKIISGSMVENEGVEKIDFGDNGITDLGVATLASALGKKGKKTQQNPLMNPLSLKSICLTTNDISSDGLSVYSGILNLCKIVDLEMSTCMITDDGCKVLSPNLAKSIHLTLLDLSSNLITADGLWGMVEGLRKNNSLQILRLNDNRLLDGGGRGIATVLTGNKSLKEVNLCGNGIGPKGVIPIAKAVACRHVAMELWLSGNSFLQDYGAKITVQLLKEKNPIVTVYT